MDYSKDYNDLSIAELDAVVPEVITPLKDLLEAYDTVRKQITSFEEKLEPLKGYKDILKEQIIKTFKERGEFTTRIEGLTASLAVRKTAKIVNEEALVKDLEERGLAKDYVSKRANALFTSIVLPTIVKNHEHFAGVEIQETEYLTCRANDKKDARKIVTTDYIKLTKK